MSNIEKPDFDVVVIGGGASGLGAAYYLCAAGKRVAVLEAENELGGILRTVKRPTYELEQAYNHQFGHNDTFFKLISELGLDSQMYWGKAKTGFLFRDKLFGFSGGMDLLRFSALTLRERLELALRLLSARYLPHPGSHDNVSVAQWLHLRKGSPSAELFNRLTEGKFGKPADEISAAFLWERFRARALTRHKVPGHENFGYLCGSLSLFTKKLVEHCRGKGAKIETNCRVLSVKGQLGNFVVSCADGRSFSARQVLSTLPLNSFAKVADCISDEGRRVFESFEYMGALTVLVGIEKSLSPYYWLTLANSSVPFVVMVEQTKLYPRASEIGEHVLYFGSYASNKRVMEVSEAEILSDVRRAMGLLDKSKEAQELRWHSINRMPSATPVYSVGFGERLEKLPKLSGLWHTGAAFSYPMSRNVDSMLKLAQQVSNQMLLE